MARLTPAAIALSALSLAGAGMTAAFAQSTTPSSTTTARPAPGPLPAPVGHRQPTRTDVPPEGPSANGQADAEDKALDRKIKNICKGC